MANSKYKKKFSFSYAELFEQALEKLAFAERDIAEITNIGINATKIAQLATAIDNYKSTKSDELMLKLITIEVSKKDLTRYEIEQQIINLMGSAGLALGVSTAEYRSFLYKKIDQLTDAGLLFRADYMCDRADLYATPLATKGITATDVLAIRNKLIAFKAQMKLTENAKMNREFETQKRLTTADLLYTELADICNAGKVYYQSKNEAKYNDYIIYDTSENIQSRTGTLAKNETKSRNLVDLTPNTTLIATNESEGFIKIYFSKSMAGKPTTKFITLQPSETKTLNIATDLGYSQQDHSLYFTLQNMSANVATYRMKFIE